MKTILVPTDFSRHSEYALKVASQIAKKNNSKIVLLHLLEMPNAGNDVFSSSHDIPELILFKNTAMERIEELADDPCLDGLDVSYAVQFQSPTKGILDNIGLQNADLVVMGSHGKDIHNEMFVGSNAEKIVRQATVPVLLIKQEHEDFNIETFVLASDFSEENKKQFGKVVDFAKSFNAKLELVKVVTPNSFLSTRAIHDRIKSFLSEFNFTNYEFHIYNDVNVEKGILHFAKDKEADLVGIFTHGRKGLSHFFNGSISEDLMNHSKRPVIAFKI